MNSKVAYMLQIFLILQTRMEWVLGDLDSKIAIGDVYTLNTSPLTIHKL